MAQPLRHFSQVAPHARLQKVQAKKSVYRSVENKQRAPPNYSQRAFGLHNAFQRSSAAAARANQSIEPSLKSPP
jgi:hypothetical protein